ncbi:glycerophosphodiester phosphodiesterase 1-like [Glandiceps talaboti]
MVWPSSSSRRPLFTGIATVLVVIVIIHSLRIPPVDRSVVDKVLPPDKVLVFGHRGGDFNAPENTIAAIREAKKNGADGVEIDIRFTKDGVPVIFHDWSTVRTTGSNGEIKLLLFDELKKFDASYGHRLREKFPNEHIPTLEEATEECLKLGLKIFYDIKVHSYEAVNAIAELYEKYNNLYENSLVVSYPAVIYRAQLSDYFGMSVSSLGGGALVTTVIQFWKRRGIRVIPCCINSAAEKRMYEQVYKTSYLTSCVNGTCQ